MDEWKAKIQEVVGTLDKRLFIYRKLMGGKVEIYNPSTRLVAPINEGVADYEDALYFPEEMLDAVFQELQAYGYKPKDQSFIEGKFESQSDHLKDLRKLLKL